MSVQLLLLLLFTSYSFATAAFTKMLNTCACGWHTILLLLLRTQRQLHCCAAVCVLTLRAAVYLCFCTHCVLWLYLH